MRAALAAAALVLGGCANDACHGVGVTCVALTVDGQGTVDGVELVLSGAASGTMVAPPQAVARSLPVDIALALAHAQNGSLHIGVVGVYLGQVVGSGAVDTMVTVGGHTSARVTLTPGGSIDHGDGGAPDVPFDVTGTRVRHYLLGDGGVIDVPTDFTSVAVGALAPTSGDLVTIAGSGDANGNFTIRQVPAAPFYLRFDGVYVFGSSRKLDLGAFIQGRPDQATPTTRTTLSVSVTNAAPWANGDAIQFFSANAGTAIFYLETLFGPTAGATSFGGAMDLSQMAYGYLIDAAKGDDAYLTQLVADSNNGVPFVRLAKIANFPRFTISNGNAVSTSAAMTDVAQTSMPIAWTRSLFAQQRMAVNPRAVAAGDLFDVYAQPGGLAHGFFASTPDVLIVKPAAGTSDVSLTASWGNPFPSSWPLVAQVGASFAVSYTASGATAATFDGAVYTVAPFAGLTSPVAPIIGPVQSPTIDGSDAFADTPGASATPVIAWKPPALGTASSYTVSIYSIDNQAGATAFNWVTSLYTSATTVDVPPGLLVAGSSYLIAITANADTLDLTMTPFAAMVPTAWADALSGALRVAPTAVATSCQDLHATHPGWPDGVYTIDFDGSGAAPPVAVYCDMSTDGGGWTLCAWSKDSTPSTAGWAAASAAQSSNWYGCHLYSATPVEARVRVANATTAYTNRYANVDFRPSSSDTMYTPAVAAAPSLTLQLTPNEGACNQASSGNLQWRATAVVGIFGQQPRNGCNSAAGSIFINSSGVHINGCAGANQISPQLGYPCGGYGDFGIHMELWAR